jgi:hypothetical protein
MSCSRKYLLKEYLNCRQPKLFKVQVKIIKITWHYTCVHKAINGPLHVYISSVNISIITNVKYMTSQYPSPFNQSTLIKDPIYNDTSGDTYQCKLRCVWGPYVMSTAEAWILFPFLKKCTRCTKLIGAVSSGHNSFGNACRSLHPIWNETTGIQVLIICTIPRSSLSLGL